MLLMIDNKHGGLIVHQLSRDFGISPLRFA